MSHIRLLIAFMAGALVCFTVVYFRSKPDDRRAWGEGWDEYPHMVYETLKYTKDEIDAIHKTYDHPALCQRTEAHPDGCAYATLVNGNEYIELALVLGESLRETNSPYPLIALTTNRTSQSGIALLERAGLIVHHVTDLPLPANVQPWRDNWRYTYVKLLLWSLTTYERIVAIDADSLILSNMDGLFQLPGEFFTAIDRHLCKHDLEPGVSGMAAVLWPDAKVAKELLRYFNSSGYNFARGDQVVSENFFELRKSMSRLNETWSSFVYRCQCEDFPFREGDFPKSVHFTGWFRPHVSANGVSVPMGLSSKARECAQHPYLRWEAMWKKAMARVGMSMEEFLKENIRHVRG